MKKSQLVALVLITSALASCNKKSDDWSTDKRTDNKKVYMRSDTTAPYAHTHRHHGSGLLWFYAFRSFGHYNNGHFSRSGYYSSGLGSRANLGNNSSKSSVVRGGFGHSSSYVSS